MNLFYERALGDTVIGYIFTDVARLDLEHHLPIIGDFWESLLFGTPAYQKHGRNPLLVHKDLHMKSELTREHFERWLEIFTATVDDLFSGERADQDRKSTRLNSSHSQISYAVFCLKKKKKNKKKTKH